MITVCGNPYAVNLSRNLRFFSDHLNYSFYFTKKFGKILDYYREKDMIIKNFIFAFLALFMTCICSEAILAAEARLLYNSSDETGFFCSFEPSESGDNPDSVLVTNQKGVFYLFVGHLSEEEWSLVATMNADTPIKYDVQVIFDYNE
jgi:hypothetical protein